ncbi:MAG: polyprenyl synthetase family protein, partial [Thermoflexales bacterium]|nr:polyprenyl synthetase family protein [Thermoflexales bacterium]
WGEAQAINAGDAMFALAHLALLRCAEAGAASAQVVRMFHVFDETCLQLTVGQHLDLSFESRSDVSADEYLAMIGGKTAALIAAACRIGALCANAAEAHAEALETFGRGLGLAFQLQDDILGIWGDPASTGKHSSDLAHRKKTLPVLFAAERDPAVRDRYFGDPRPLTAEEIELLRTRIEHAGGRSHAEKMAEQAYAQAISALHALPPSNARESLAQLARELLNRSA